MAEQDAFTVLDVLFKTDPQPPKHYNLRLDEDNPENKNVNFHDILMTVFLNGMKTLDRKSVV